MHWTKDSSGSSVTTTTMTIKEAKEITGGLTTTSKMPCPSYSLPASSCITGNKLADMPEKNTVCSRCYARKGFYFFAKVAQKKRLDSLTDERWTDAMITLIEAATKKVKYFRWHDSGDIQSVEHFDNIVEIARSLPKVKFWLPTKEWSTIIVKSAHVTDLPKNLTIRRSMFLVDSVPDQDAPGLYAAVHTHETKDGDWARVFYCPSQKTGGKCGRCRECWSANCKVVSYKNH